MSADICRAIMSCINVEYGLVPTSQSCPSIKRQDTPCSRSRDGCIAAGCCVLRKLTASWRARQSGAKTDVDSVPAWLWRHGVKVT